jgi:hypothetical protein
VSSTAEPVSGIARWRLASSIRVSKHVDLGWPPAVDRLLGDPGARGDPLDRDGGEPPLDQQVVGGVQDGQARLLVASVRCAPPRSALRCGRGLLWHDGETS